ncbi:MAG: hypothetical protein K0S47_2738 [Herbinix sp.]|jgi:hypothetical protein|nr:hypothetical protein [Herbinix sp.]
MPELLKFAFTGGNIIPTVLLILVVLYWIIVIIGALDLDFLDFDLDLDGGDATGPFYSLLAFLKVGELPVMFVLSILILNFWIIAMFMYYLPIAPGGGLNTLLLFPAMLLSIFFTKFEFLPFKGIIKKSNRKENSEDEIIRRLCKLKSETNHERLGQAEIERDGASVIINVKPEFEEESFRKDEIACVFRKDSSKDIYYIVKVEGVI